MGTQNFNLKEVDNVVYNSKRVDTLTLNDQIIWQGIPLHPRFPLGKIHQMQIQMI